MTPRPGRHLLLALLWCMALPMAAQPPGGPGPRQPANGKVYGRVLDAATRKPAEFATVAVRLQRNDSLLGGTIVRANGDFSVEGLPLAPVTVEVSFIGFGSTTRQVDLGPGAREVDLGNLLLEPDAQLLQEVEVTGRASQVVMKADRRVFNVERDLSTRGGTGTDVMKNVPGLSVDAEGNVELRGGSPQVLIDGRPSAITLDQLPSEEIERVEVITNPSVAFDASSTGGIINVVLKKNTKPGYFGQLQAGIGTNDRYQASGNLNVKEGRFGFNLGYNWNTSNNITTGRTERIDRANGEDLRHYRQDADNDHTRSMHGGRFGVDYEISNRNTISFSQSVRSMRMAGDDRQVFRTDSSGTGTSGHQYNTNNGENLSLSSQLLFRRKGPKEGREWTADVTYNRWQRDSRSAFATTTFDAANEQFSFSPR
ncbi:MAG: carboxypeptidase regulatory-like domain-containing protein, partial [Flavobacteriales bacterium]|nr:carboxypeptidase regulatory-like domain-containing protein [Flavobacteriales bacterium]